MSGPCSATQTPGGSKVASPPARRRWPWTRDAVLAASLANLCFITGWHSLLHVTSHGYFNKLPATRVTLLALLANLCWSTLLIWVVIQGFRRSRSHGLRVACRVVFIGLLVLPLDFSRREFFHVADATLLAFLRQPVVLICLLPLAVGLIWMSRRAVRAAAAVVWISLPLALLTLGRVLLVLCGLVHLEQASGTASCPPPSPAQQRRARVLWIIFDETDQRVTFERRPPGLGLPEFDALRAEALYAVNAYPPADETLRSLPALTLGRPVATASITNASDLALKLADTGEVTSWSEQPSVFDAARKLGVNTALIGWYHPYSRILGHALNHCQWYPYPGFEPAQASTFGEAVKRQIYCLVLNQHLRYLFAGICRASLEESVAIATNELYGLVFLHLPPPHKPGVFLPDSNRFTTFSFSKVEGYFNNLALADRSLGKLRAALRTSGRSTNSWLVLSADHSWRESRLYDGRRDFRVPFLVLAPSDTQALTYSEKLNTVSTRDLVLAILRGEVTNQLSVGAWLDRYRSAQPTILGSSGPED